MRITLRIFQDVTNYLKELTFGIYQIELAPSYIQDKLDIEETDVFQFDEHRRESGFIRIRLYSRFRNQVKYQMWIAYQSDDNNDELILGYYCTCKTGARTLGCCAHVTSIIWYLGYARHQFNVKYPSRAVLNRIMDATERNDQEQDDILDDLIE